MSRRSAGIVLVRLSAGGPEVLLVHPGGPLWAKRDAGAWSIPKGEYELGDDPLEAARREFLEEIGVPCPAEELIELGEVVQGGGKRVTAWCGLGEVDPAHLGAVADVLTNAFEMEWPPRSGRRQRFPEVDRACYFPIDVAHEKILAGQRPLLDSVSRLVAESRLATRRDTE